MTEIWFDPHFHIWDVSPESEGSTASVSGIDPAILFAPNGKNLYGTTEYEAEMDESEAVRHIGGLHTLIIFFRSLLFNKKLVRHSELPSSYHS